MTQPSDAPKMASLREGFSAVVVGASGGVGAAIACLLADNPRCGRVHALSRSGEVGELAGVDAITQGPIDLTDADSVARAMDDCGEDLDLVVCAAGVLHGEDFGPEKSWRQIEADAFAHVFAVNTIGPALLARHALDRLGRGRKTAFAALSARVGSISDNRLGGWHAYRASKAALNMLIRNFAIELARRNRHALAVGLHPGTVDTPLSEPFQANVPEGKLFTPDYSAARLLHVLDGLTPQDSGDVFAWDGQPVPA